MHVENYNNYIYALEVVANNQALQIPPGSGIGSLLSGGSEFAGIMMPGFSGSGAGDGYIDIESGGFGFADAADDESMNMFMLYNNQYSAILDELVAEEREFLKIQKEVEVVQQLQEFRAVGLAEVRRIKYNPDLSPEQVKKMSNDFLKKILEVESEEEITLDYVVQKGDDRQKLAENLKKLESTKKDYGRTIEKLDKLSEEISNLSFQFDEWILLQTKIEEIHNKAEKELQTIDQHQEIIGALYEKSGKQNLQKMTAVWYEYEGLKANDFSYTYRTEAAGDRTVLGIKFTARDSLGNVLPINKKELVPIRVPVYGGMKINVSIGLSFSQFFERPQSYFLQDTIIRSEDADGFVPVITSFFHFYPQSAGDVSIGGSFGVGIPLSTSSFGNSLSFFLGPSFIFGKGQRVVLSTGIMGGKTEQLSQGVKVGDVMPQFSSVPTKTGYKMGYFLGVSFNIGGG